MEGLAGRPGIFESGSMRVRTVLLYGLGGVMDAVDAVGLDCVAHLGFSDICGV